MVEDTRLDVKLHELSRELIQRQMVPGFPVVDAYAVKGLDDGGKPGLFAAILLAPHNIPDLGDLTLFRDVLTAKLRQVDTKLPASPVVVQGAPEQLDANTVVPGGPAYFTQVKADLDNRKHRFERLMMRTLPQKVTITLPAEMLKTAKPAKGSRGRATVSARTTRKPARKPARSSARR